ncbi:hypothetical protein BJ944DRAFT_30267 [Cunninghamella echinulata]|nr:hypothetical protein BJ944DRAFT_30267 [Cunninghamella echinulata]
MLLHSSIYINGEQTSDTTSEVRKYNEGTYGFQHRYVSGRKIDGIIRCEDMELALLEWKVNSQPALLKQQQVKNIRSNSCLLYMLNSFAEGDKVDVVTMDWAGTTGYIYALSQHDEVIVVNKIEDLFLPVNKYELKHFKNTIKLLFNWKTHIMSTANKCLGKYLLQKRKRKLNPFTDGSSSPSTSSPSTPPYMYCSPSPVFFTPKKSRK